MTAPDESHVDVIVVGAGGSGAPLAARLSDDPVRRVLLLEAGHAPRTREDFPPELLDASTVQGAMPGHLQNWAYPAHLTPDRPYTIARGRILGGSTAINGASLVRPPREDFDAWERIAGPEWSYDAVLPTFRRLESDADYGATAVHGAAGPVRIIRSPPIDDLPAAFEAAALEMGFPAESDKNAPGPPGVGPVPLGLQGGLHGGTRGNTALAYLHPVADRPNLEVRGDSRVSRLIIDGGRAVGVELSDGSTVRAAEVVLSAGAIGTPQLLMVSGIGPAAALTRLGIDVVADLPVGAGFSDHPDLAVGWRPSRPLAPASVRAAFPMALNFSSSDAYPAGDLEILLSVEPLGTLLLGANSAERIPQHDDLQLIVALQRPESRGTITLTSADPADFPRIDYRYLETAADRERLRTGIRVAVRLLRSRAFAGLFGGLTELDDPVLDDDDALDAWMLAHLGTAIHLCGSAPMGRAGSPGAVVDSFGRVHGVAGLRIADTSILPTVPSRGPAAMAILIGERIAEFIARGG